MTLFTSAISHVGLTVVETLAEFGRFIRFAGTTAMWILARPGAWARWRLLGPQLFSVGVASIPVVAATRGG